MKMSNGATGLMVAGACAVLVATSASAVTDTTFRYTTAKTGFFTISVLAMKPDSSLADYSVTLNDGLSTAGAACFSTGVNLPLGAKITNLRIVGKTPGSDKTISTVLQTWSLQNGASAGIIGANHTFPSNGAVAARDVAPGVPVAVDASHAYGFQVCLNAGQVFLGARVTYTYQSAGD